ncbi:MAG: NAD(P)-dependent alcohol dehydrogenase [Anaerolineae bacterium]|nr:NAD(P)-dependent alcohol dehydrogenase [Anaerolineae bacterium]
MQAMVYTNYGSPDELQMREVAKPVPKANEVLIRVRGASINIADWYMLRGNPFMIRLMSGGLRKPKATILGTDVAGMVEAVGSAVTRFKVGDEVYGDLSACGWGSFAEYVAAPETMLALKPRNLSFEAAASVPLAGVTALQGVRDVAKIRHGQRVLINGASGGVGTFAVLLAKHYGAQVTATSSTNKMAMVRSIGADQVLDYTQVDVTQNDERYDVIFDIAAYRSMLDYRPALCPDGLYVIAGGDPNQILKGMAFAPLMSLLGSQTARVLSAKPSAADLSEMTALIEAGSVRPVIDKCYPLAQLADAFRYFGDRHTQGKVVISVV